MVDNPPFSLLAKICRFYQSRRVPFFLFAPTLTLFSGRDTDVTYLPCGASITYANGAKVNTSFVTNLDTCLLRTVPDLYATVKQINNANEKAMTKTLPKYSFPPHVLTAAAAYQFSHYGIPFRVEKTEAVFIRKLDAMKAHVWTLSNRERAIVAGLSGGEEGHSPHAANPDPFDLETLMNLPKEAT